MTQQLSGSLYLFIRVEGQKYYKHIKLTALTKVKRLVFSEQQQSYVQQSAMRKRRDSISIGKLPVLNNSDWFFQILHPIKAHISQTANPVF